MRPRDSLFRFSDEAARLARIVIDEDGASDVTSDALDISATAIGHLTLQGSGVVAGFAYAQAVCDRLGCEVSWEVAEGESLKPETRFGRLSGTLANVLRVERPVLNLLQRASGIATATRAYVAALEGTGCIVLHTRKTAPGLRSFDIAAVLAGGGSEHRCGLDREVMFKDNHWKALSATGRSLGDVLDEARQRNVVSLQVEVESASQVRTATGAGATRLLIDNQPVASFRELAALARDLDPEVEIEATGRLTLESVRSYADAGAQFVSVGMLTHSVTALDIGLEIVVPG